MSQISIPPPITLPKPRDWDEIDGPMPVFHIKTIHFSKFLSIFQDSRQMYRLCIENPITVLSNSSQTVGFPVLFLTSLPALCVLTCDSFLHRYKLSHTITIVSTNDTYPHITLFNYTKKPITISHLSVYCQIVLSGKPFNFFRE